MQYRTLKRAGDPISVIGLGAEHMETMPYDKVKSIVDTAMEAGINYTDLFMGSPDIRDHFGKALHGRRQHMMIAGHLGAAWINDQYHRTRDPKICRTFFDDLLTRLNTDYIDVLMLHFIDTDDDYATVFNGEMLALAKEYKQKGAARMIGMSSHNPRVAAQAAATGDIDIIMFSTNPVFDLLPSEMVLDDQFGDTDSLLQQGNLIMPKERADFYTTCAQHNVDIVAMKAFYAGRLLSGSSTIHMTPAQCIQYALDRPGMACTLAGVRTVGELIEDLEYTQMERVDYTRALQSLQFSQPKCMYCNHCLPCPAGIDIADYHRQKDAGVDVSAIGATCIACGVCEARCPFDVPVIQNMRSV